MFIGEHLYSIDEKRRVGIPAKFRKELGIGAVITKGLDNCLVLYPIKEWKSRTEKLQEMPLARRGYVRITLSGAVDIKFDKLGRTLIPDYLKKYARLKKNVIIIGLGNRIEIWDKKAWDDYRAKSEGQIESIAEKLEELGI